MTLAELDSALAMLKRQGVKSYVDVAGGGFEVEFWPSSPDFKPSEALKDEDKCRCGHAQHEHNAGLCLLGCDPERCAPEAS